MQQSRIEPLTIIRNLSESSKVFFGYNLFVIQRAEGANRDMKFSLNVRYSFAETLKQKMKYDI